jgi:hypothetical protein
MNAQPGTVTISATEYAKLCERVDHLEEMLYDLAMIYRRQLVTELGNIEDRLGLPRTKEKRVR